MGIKTENNRKIGTRLRKIIVIQSLRPSDEKTGLLLHDDLQTLELWYNRGLKTAFHNVGCKAELTGLLSHIEKEVASDWEVPVIHFEMHGNSQGLCLALGEFISWEQLKSHLIRINILTRNNLLIALAACYGAYFSKVLMPMDRTPCWALVGPQETILPGNLLKSYLEFYREIFETGNGSRAIERLNDAVDPKKKAYFFAQCEFFFKFVYRRYLKEYFATRVLKVRAEKLYLKLKAANKDVRHPKDVKKMLLQGREKHFEKHRERFFMMDLYPENRKRFNVTYQDVVNFRQPNGPVNVHLIGMQ